MSYRLFLSIGLAGALMLETNACHGKELERRSAADGTSRQVVKAREALSKKLDVPFGNYFLVRQGMTFAAIRLLEPFHRSVLDARNTGATYDCAFSSDGSGNLNAGQIETGEVFERRAPTDDPHVSSSAGEKTNIQCGPFRIGWSEGNWIYPKGRWSGEDLHRHAKDAGAEVAETSARSLKDIDVFSTAIDWLRPW